VHVAIPVPQLETRGIGQGVQQPGKRSLRLKKVAGLVLTHNRKDLLQKTINAHLGQTWKPAKLIVVNNASTDGTDAVLEVYKKQLPADFFEVVTLPENIGSSGGFTAGLKHIINTTDCDWIWLMDDDAIPEPRALEKMRHYYDNLEPKKKKRVGILQNERVLDYEKFLGMDIPKEDVRGKQISYVTFEGYCVSRRAVDKIGYPRHEFFLYSDDIEYNWRAISHGFRVHRVLGSFIYHRDWAKLGKINRGIINKPNVPPWKLYYRFRNPFLIMENKPVIRFFLMIILAIDYFFWAFVNPENAYYAKKGLIDGINLVSGKIVEPQRIVPPNK